jgi:hypothetical protein
MQFGYREYRAILACFHSAFSSRVLELTLELERSVADITAIVIGPAALPTAPSSATATQIAQQIIYGNFTSIAATGDGTTIQIAAPEKRRTNPAILVGLRHG